MKCTHIGFSILLLLGVAAASATAAERVDPARWAPEDAVFFVGVTDIKEVWDDFKKTGSYKFFNDPELARSASEIGMVGQFADAIRAHVAELVGVAPDQLQNPLAGPMALYGQVAPGSDPNEDLLAVLIAGVGDQDTMKKYFDSAVDKLKQQYDTHEEVSAGSATIHAFKRQGKSSTPAEEDPFSELDKPSDSPEQIIEKAMGGEFNPQDLPPHMAVCLTDDALIIGTTADDVRAALRRDRDRSLADTEDYKALLRCLKPTGNVRLLVNIPRITGVARQAMKGDEAEEFRRWTSVIGTQSLRSVVGHMRLGASSYELKFELLFLMGGQRSGLAEILSMDNRPTAPPMYVPADACMYASINANVGRILDQVERMVRQADPQAADEMRTSLEKVQLPVADAEPVNLRQELLQYLTGPITLDLIATRPYTPENIRAQATVGSHDTSAVNRFLTRLEGQLLSKRDVRGTQVYDIPVPPGLSIATLSDRILVTEASALDAALAASSEPLAQTPAWQRAARFVPREAWLTLWTDNRKLIQAAMELAKDPAAQMAMASPGPRILSYLTPQAQQAVSGDSQEVMRKMMEYATTNVMTIATTPQGVQFTMIAIKPE